MEIPNNVRKLIYGMFDTMIEGVDKYDTKSSTWLIFTEQKRWVIEFTNEKTLWFNYNLFQSELNLLSMDCVESKDIIKEWFESRFLGIDVVEETLSTAGKPLKVEDTIQNGVKNTLRTFRSISILVEDTIQNGVKEVKSVYLRSCLGVGDAIQNGVKEVEKGSWFNALYAEDVIQNGVKETYECFNGTTLIEDIIENGVKHVEDGDWLDQDERIDDIIESGVKETKHRLIESYEQKDHQVTTLEISQNIKNAIENGVKE